MKQYKHAKMLVSALIPAFNEYFLVCKTARILKYLHLVMFYLAMI